MESIQRKYSRKERPIRVVQFGEGNFLRAFVDYMLDKANGAGVFDGDVAIVKPIAAGDLSRFKEQDNLYTVLLRGMQEGKPFEESHVVTCVQKVVDSYAEFDTYMALADLPELRFVVSNTTEAGITYDETDRFDAAPAATFPGKLTQFLYRRFQTFGGAADKGLILLPVELIENNGGKLRECVLRLAERWALGAAFAAWVEEACIFCSTLVDRIVTGYPRGQAEQLWEQLGYKDDLLDTCEPFALWVIESEKDISAELPLDRAGLPVVFTNDQRPFRERKVRILNGEHTATVLAAYLMGRDIVAECVADPLIRRYMDLLASEEILPTVKLPREEVLEFTRSVFERYQNPFVRHELLSISLNSVSKWKSRILPTFRDRMAQTGKVPRLLTFSFAALAAFYTADERDSTALTGHRVGNSYPIQDDAPVLDFFAAHSKAMPHVEFIRLLAGNAAFWGEDLNTYPGFTETATADYEALLTDPETAMKAAVEQAEAAR